MFKPPVAYIYITIGIIGIELYRAGVERVEHLAFTSWGGASAPRSSERAWLRASMTLHARRSALLWSRRGSKLARGNHEIHHQRPVVGEGGRGVLGTK